jgi:GNAT superfamily N-acetyltransferase
MLESPCFCGEMVAGVDVDTLVDSGVAHFGLTHPELGLTETSVRNYFEGEQRLSGPTERLASIGEIMIRPVSPKTKEDIIEFFDHRAFAGNPGWSMCYCMYYHLGGSYSEEWSQRSWQQNRSDISDRVDTGATTGVVAYIGGELAGWCNATSRSEFPGRSEGGVEGVASIACFVVAPPYRGHGVQRALLDGAVDLLGDLGFARAEAYPIVDPKRGASAFVGTLDLYKGAGFEVVSEDPLVVQRELA